MSKLTTFADRIRKQATAKKNRAVAEEQARIKAMKSGELDPESEGWEGINAKENASYELPDSFDDYGLGAARVLQAFAKTALNNQGTPQPLEIPKVLSDHYKEKGLSKLVEKDYELRTPDKGGMFQMHELLWAEFVPVLRAHAPLMQLGARVFPMKGTLSIPGLANGHTAGYVGEKASPDATSTTFNDIKLSSKKLATKTCISWDLIEETDRDVLEIIKDDLVDLMGSKMTEQGVFGTASKYAPGGLLSSGDIQTVAVGAAWDQDTGLDGLQKLWEANLSVDASQCGWMMNPALRMAIAGMTTTTGAFIFRDEINSGMHHGSPVAVYNGLPVTSGAPDTCEAIFGYWRDFIIGVARSLSVATSNEAAFRMNDGSMASAWDIEAVLLKLTHKHDFAIRRNDSFVHFTGIEL